MHRDHMLCSVPDANGGYYGVIPANEFIPAPNVEPQPHEYGDLSQIRSEDLMPLFGENTQSLNHLIHEECEDNQAVHQVLPDLEEHDKGGFNFELNLAPQKKGKVNWFYSQQYNKVYIKTNEIFNVDVVYRPRVKNDKMYMRAMMVFNSEVSEPVVRCENHSSKDLAEEKNIKHSVLRCENSNVIYQGSVNGKNVSDRLSVRIPLGCVQPNEDNLVKQTIALKFVCQNSCVGRRETSIIFYLENAKGEVLAKKITAVKICSCPKRDMKKDETAEFPKKRSRKDICPVGKKILKLESDIKVEEVEQDNEDDDGALADGLEPNDVVITPNSVKLFLILPNLESACHVTECAFNKVAGQMALNPENFVLQSKFRALKKTLIKLQAQRDQEK